MITKSQIQHKVRSIKAALLSARGKNILTFMLFIVISLVLWIVKTLNEDVQQDFKCVIEIVNKPDSVTMITELPSSINVTVKARGSNLVKYHFGFKPVISIDYQKYIRGSVIALGESDLRTILRQRFGAIATISNLNPDSLNIKFTSLPPRRLPVVVDSRVTADPTAMISTPPVSLTEYVDVYSIHGLPGDIKTISTYPVELTDLLESRIIKTKLKAPAGCRVIPDSVEVRIDVERLLVTKSIVTIEPVNVPKGVKLLLFPNRIDAGYMVTADKYSSKTPSFRVVADYRWIEAHPGATHVRLNVIDDGSVKGINLAQDSVKFMIER